MKTNQWAIAESDLMIHELMEKIELSPSEILVVGCSTSEVRGGLIGKDGSMEIAEQLCESLLKAAEKKQIYLAFQCCEHLNRALVVERKMAKAMNLRQVWAKPVPHAGGSMATTAWSRMKDPILVEAIQADAGLDIGQTLIGMHLKSVVVPIRLSRNLYGDAVITAAKTRPPLIGGSRAQYPEGSYK